MCACVLIHVNKLEFRKESKLKLCTVLSFTKIQINKKFHRELSFPFLFPYCVSEFCFKDAPSLNRFCET